MVLVLNIDNLSIIYISKYCQHMEMIQVYLSGIL